MTSHWGRAVAFVGLLAIAAACAPRRATARVADAPPATWPAGRAAALVTPGAAYFAFPLGAPARFLPTAEDSAQGYPGQGLIWSVTWDVPDEGVGRLPHGVDARGGVPTVPAGADTLTVAAAAATGGHYVFCVACTTPTSRLVPEAAVTAAARGGQVVLSVRGRGALRRLWPAGPPDSVALFWRGPGPQRASLRVPLERAP